MEEIQVKITVRKVPRSKNMVPYKPIYIFQTLILRIAYI